MYVNIDKCLLNVSQISIQAKLLKCTETMSWLCNGLTGTYNNTMPNGNYSKIYIIAKYI